MEKWTKVLIKDICTLKNGKKRPSIKGEYPVFGGNGIIDYANEYNHNRSVIIGRVGAYCGCVFDSKTKCWVSDNAISAQPKDNCDFSFLYYLLVYKKLNNHQIGGAQPLLTQDLIGRIQISLPPLPLQRRISAILSSLDDKIACNQKICRNLEEQAQALFKDWFVDFTPFKNQPFIDTELGKIPMGWKVLKANEIYDINIGKTPPRAEQQWFSKNKSTNKIWISISDMGNCGIFIDDSKEYLTPQAQEKFNVVMVPANTILLSFKLTIGRVAIADNELTTNEAIARFILPNLDYREFTYLYLKQYKYGSLGSTSSIATAVNSKIIKAMPFILPPKSILKDFSKITHVIFENIKTLQQESSRLSALRDTLLPRLMSGEIAVLGGAEEVEK